MIVGEVQAAQQVLISGIGAQHLELGRNPDVLEERAVLLVRPFQPVERRLLLAGDSRLERTPLVESIFTTRTPANPGR